MLFIVSFVSWILLRFENTETVYVSVCRTASPVSLMKFSPDGEFFATAGQVGYLTVLGLWVFYCKQVSELQQLVGYILSSDRQSVDKEVTVSAFQG